MQLIVHIVLPYLLLYKYWAIFSLTFIAALAFPIPPGTLLMAASAFAAQGYFSLVWIILAGTAGNVLGDSVGYFIARKYGKRLLRKLPFFRKVFLSEKYARLEKRIQNRPTALLFVSRFEVVSNLSVNILAGMSEVPYAKYLVITAIGELAQVSAYCIIGYLVGDNWQAIAELIGRFLILIVLVLAILAIIFWKRIVRRITR